MPQKIRCKCDICGKVYTDTYSGEMLQKAKKYNVHICSSKYCQMEGWHRVQLGAGVVNE